jgi:hypothetical protein
MSYFEPISEDENEYDDLLRENEVHRENDIIEENEDVETNNDEAFIENNFLKLKQKKKYSSISVDDYDNVDDENDEEKQVNLTGTINEDLYDNDSLNLSDSP